MNEKTLRKALEDIHQRATDGSPRSKDLFSVIIAQIAEEALRATLQPPSGQVGEELVHLVRFLANYQWELCEIRAKAMKMLHLGDSEGARDLLVLHWPIVQGSQNQWDLETIGKQPFDMAKMRPAIKAMLDGSALRTQPQAPVVEPDKRDVVLPWVELQDLLFYFHTVGDEKAESMLMGLQPAQAPVVDVPSNRWISVSEGLPESTGTYAVWRFGRKNNPGRSKFVVGHGFGGRYPNEITHWTASPPLPPHPDALLQSRKEPVGEVPTVEELAEGLAFALMGIKWEECGVLTRKQLLDDATKIRGHLLQSKGGR